MKKKFGAGALVTTWLFGFAAAVLCCTLLFVSKYGGAEAFPYTTKYATVLKTLNEHYVGELDEQLASDSACYALVASTGDRWSRYMTAEEYAQYRLFQQNSYMGIGVTVQTVADEKYPLITGLTEDAPAQLAGAEIGDYMLSLNGKDLRGMAAEEIKALITESGDAPFELEILRGERRLTLTVKSGVVLSQPVKYEMLDNKIGYIRIKNFEERAGESTVAAVDELASQGAKSIILDVRCNPGGLLSELLTALDHLLPEGEVFVSCNRSGTETIKTSDAEYVKLPLAVLIDENTYSAAEFFAAALSEYDRAVLVGGHSTGKSRSQITIPLSDGSAVHLSVNRYLTPKRVDLSEAGGLAPDVAEALPEELLPYLYAGALPHSEDAQLQAAVSALGGD